jgi:rubrerythrin
MKVIKNSIKEAYVSTNLDIQPSEYKDVKCLVRSLRESLIAELDAANLYETIVHSLEISNLDIPDEIHERIQDIANEEKVHVGEFQRCLKLVSNDLDYFDQGMNEKI